MVEAIVIAAEGIIVRDIRIPAEAREAVRRNPDGSARCDASDMPAKTVAEAAKMRSAAAEVSAAKAAHMTAKTAADVTTAAAHMAAAATTMSGHCGRSDSDIDAKRQSSGRSQYSFTHLHSLRCH